MFGHDAISVLQLPPAIHNSRDDIKLCVAAAGLAVLRSVHCGHVMCCLRACA